MCNRTSWTALGFLVFSFSKYFLGGVWNHKFLPCFSPKNRQFFVECYFFRCVARNWCNEGARHHHHLSLFIVNENDLEISLFLRSASVWVPWKDFRKKWQYKQQSLPNLPPSTIPPAARTERKRKAKRFFLLLSPSKKLSLGRVIIIFILRFLKPQNITDRNGLAEERFSRWQKHSWSDRERTTRIF